MDSTPVPPFRVEFATSDPDEARDAIDQTYGGAGLRVRGPADGDWSVSFSLVDAGLFSSSVLKLPGDIDFTVEGHDEVLVTMFLDGRAGYERGKSTERVGPGDLCIGNCPGAHWSAHTHQPHAAITGLPETLLRDVARGVPGGARPWRLLDHEPIPGGVGLWRTTAAYVDTLLADPTAHAPLLIGSVARLLAATALTVFPNTAWPDPGAIDDRRDGHSATVDRAIAFIEADPGRDITVVDIAAAARVTPRAVQYAFQRHLGMTPMAYLRRIRLEAAHQDLRDADPAGGTTVTTVANRWGFAHLGRFATAYRTAYGHSPSHTLRS